MPATIDLTALPAVTNAVFYPLYGATHRFLVLMGGAGSGKSYFAAMKWAVRLMREPGHHVGAFRKVARTCRTSVFAQFRRALSTLGVLPLWDINLTEMTFTFRGNGNVFRCLGMDDQEKLKSIEGLTGAWLEEATEFLEVDLEQINLRIRGETRFYKQIVLSFNPISALHWLKKRFFECDDPDALVVHTTYRDNRFLDAAYVKQLRALQERDPQLGAVYAEGRWGVLEGLIYRPPTPYAWPDGLDVAGYGLDFGFTNPTALIQVGLRDVDPVGRVGNVYLRELVYEPGLTTADLSKRMTAMGVRKDKPIYADPAEPDRIVELSRQGWKCYRADKGPGSVRAGIDLCRSLTLHVTPDSVNLSNEFGTYKWRTTRDGQNTDEPLEFMDHAMDAFRYFLWTHLRFPGVGVEGGAFAGVGVF
jgi:phage terminase large subunit